MKRKLFEKLSRFSAMIENSSFNKIDDNGNSKRGIITYGLPYLSLLDILEDITEKPDILKLGVVYPIPRNVITEFLKNHEEVKILEELDDILEMKIKSLAYDRGLKTKITGKKDIEEWMGEYTPDKVYTIIRNIWPDLLPARPETGEHKPSIPPRPPQMCPGCGHRSAFHAIKKALGKEDITVGDIGCHTLGFLPPYNIGQVLLCMGHSCGTASGISLFNDKRKVVAFLGDSTFYHAGLPGIINSLFNKHNHTLIIMENGTTAMTGHQDNPSSGRNFNEISERIPIRKVLEGLGVKNIYEVDTYQQDKLTDAVKSAMNEDGFSVVIAKHPCMLKFSRGILKSGRKLPKPVDVNEKCNKSHVCVSDFTCPSYQLKEDGSVWVQEDLCIGDGSCKQTCPAGAITSKKLEQ
jgi:indolepyruvate ferredoxin oxidoreductase alpha subunit